jgi:hypothetical protein
MRRQLLTAGFAEREMQAFQHDLSRSGKQSVDAFLEHRAEFLNVGKAAIASALLPFEREECFFTENEQNWYEYFFNKLNARFEEFDQNTVSVLTFNYDRSLEHYLFTTLKNAYGKSAEQCAAKLRSLPIIHLHGQLGDLPYMASNGVEFGAEVSSANLQKCVNGIRVVHEHIGTEPQFAQAHCHLRRAERICFLGFGYDETNLARLAEYGPTANQEHFGSTVGFIGREVHFLEVHLKRLGFATGYSLDRSSKDSLEFLRNSCVLDWE